MAKVIEIGIGSEGKAFRQGIDRDVIPPLEDAQKALLDLGKDGTKSGDKIEDALKDAQRETKESKKDIAKLAAEMEAAGKSGKRIGDGVKDGTGEAGEAVREFGDEAKQNISETFSSFRGEAEDLVQVVQDTFGGIVSSLGPAGLILGTAVAAGIGVAVQQGQNLAEAINDAKERAAELAAEIIAVDGDLTQISWADRVQEWGLAINDSREWFEFWQTEAKTAFDVAEEGAKATGVAFKDLVLAMSGQDVNRAEKALGKIRDQLVELEAQRKRTRDTGTAVELESEIQLLQKLIAEIEKQTGVTEDGIELSRKAAEATAELRAEEEAAAAALQARTDAAAALQSELDETVDSWQEYIDAETGAIDPRAYIDAMAQRIAATSSFNSNVQTLADEFGLAADEVQAILDQGVDFAPMLQQIIDSGLAPEFVAQVQAAVGGGQDILNGNPLATSVEVGADTTAADRQLADTAEPRETVIEAQPKTGSAEAALNALATKKRTATITAEADLTAARNALNSFVNERRVAIVTIDTRDREGRQVP